MPGLELRLWGSITEHNEGEAPLFLWAIVILVENWDFHDYLEHFCGSRIKAGKTVSWNLERQSDSSYMQQRVLNDNSIWYQLLAAFLRLPLPSQGSLFKLIFCSACSSLKLCFNFWLAGFCLFFQVQHYCSVWVDPHLLHPKPQAQKWEGVQRLVGAELHKVDWAGGSGVSLYLLRLVTPCQCLRLLPGSGTLPCPSASSLASSSLVLLAWDDWLFLSRLFGVGAHRTAYGSLKVTVLLPLLSDCQEYRCEPPHPAQTACFRFAFCWLYKLIWIPVGLCV